VQREQHNHPRFTDAVIRSWWDSVWESAVNEAGRDMNQPIPNPPSLTWEDVFEAEYRWPEDLPRPRLEDEP
jgi:hypothetical protein